MASRREKKGSRASLVAWSLCAVFFAMTFCVYALMFLNGTDVVGAGLPFLGVASAVVGALIASRRPGNAIGWIFLGSALFAALRTLFGEYAIYGISTSPGSVPLAEVSAWLSVAIQLPGPILGFVFVPLFFPNGRPPSRRWNAFVWAMVATAPPIMFFDAFSPGVAVYGTDIRNPFGMQPLAPYSDTIQAALIVWVIAVVFIAAMSLVIRRRASSGAERQQIKWLTFAAAAIPVWFAINAPIEENFRTFFIVVDSLIIAGVPIAAGIAILRHSLYDIDLLINKTLVYGTLTASIVAVYLGMIVASQVLFRSLTGEGSQIAIVASILANVALFTPLRRGIQNFIDRRFYRRKYDARETLEAFSAKLRDETNLDHLTDDLVSAARKTMQPEHASLWQKPTESRLAPSSLDFGESGASSLHVPLRDSSGEAVRKPPVRSRGK